MDARLTINRLLKLKGGVSGGGSGGYWYISGQSHTLAHIGENIERMIFKKMKWYRVNRVH